MLRKYYALKALDDFQIHVFLSILKSTENSNLKNFGCTESLFRAVDMTARK